MLPNLRLPLIGVATVCVLAAIAVFARPAADRARAIGPLGDADCDYSVSSLDAALILQIDAGLIPPVRCVLKADANSDGQITAIDAALILQHSAGLIDLGPFMPTATPARARTRTPTRTRTPPFTRTPTPTPTQVESEGEILIRNTSYQSFTIFGPVIEVVGEVVNGLNHNVALVEITADLYSSSTTLLATSSGYACVTTLAPGTDSPFDILVIDPPTGVDHIELRVTDYFEPPSIFSEPPVGLDATITNVYTDFIGYRHLVGQVTNNSPNTYDFVSICAAFYDNAGNVVRTGLDYTSPDTLGPGEVGSFDASADEEGADIVSHRVWVDAS